MGFHYRQRYGNDLVVRQSRRIFDTAFGLNAGMSACISELMNYIRKRPITALWQNEQL
jgi:hypothetical protein